MRGVSDLEIGKMNFLIELKLSSSIIDKSDEHDRTSGQMDRYLEKIEPQKYLLLIVGLTKDEDDWRIDSLEKKAKNKCKCHFRFLEVK